jgi:hypothetical protein
MEDVALLMRDAITVFSGIITTIKSTPAMKPIRT